MAGLLHHGEALWAEFSQVASQSLWPRVQIKSGVGANAAPFSDIPGVIIFDDESLEGSPTRPSLLKRLSRDYGKGSFFASTSLSQSSPIANFGRRLSGGPLAAPTKRPPPSPFIDERPIDFSAAFSDALHRHYRSVVQPLKT